MIKQKDFPLYEESYLRQISEPVKDQTEAQELYNVLEESFPETGALAVACSQIGILKRASLIKFPKSKEFLFICNPVIMNQSDEFMMQGEGCLSFPKRFKDTVRYREVTLQYYDENMEERKAMFEELEAVVIQHEVDHMNGILYKDHVQKPYVAEKKIGRNNPCNCGSGKKHKKCCGA